MGLVVGVQRVLAVRNWTLWSRFLGNWTDEIIGKYWSNEVTGEYVDEDYESWSCCSNEAVFGD